MERKPLTQKEVRVQIDTVEKLKRRILRTVQRLKAEYPEWDDATDLRLTSFTYLHGALGNIHLCLVFLDRDLHDPSFWKSMKVDGALGKPQSGATLLRYESFIFSSLQFDFVSELENCLRGFLRALDPKACNEGRDAFKNIYACLFDTHIQNAPKATTELLDILRHSRNTVHNAGRHVTRRGQETPPIVYKGRTYWFAEGRLVGIYLDILFVLLDDVIDVLVAVVTDPQIARLKFVDDATNQEFRATERGDGHPYLGEVGLDGV